MTITAGQALAAETGAGTAVEFGKVPEALVQERVAAVAAAHPRVLADEAAFTALRQRVAAGGLPAQLAERVTATADALLGVAPVSRVMEGRRLLEQSRLCLKRTTTLAMAYRLTGKPAYLQRARAEMLASAAFPDWNPSHFLDVAEMTLALAVGYDWLYNELDAEARTGIRAAIVAKGLRTSLAPEHAGWWVRATNNWGQVCHGGLVAGALAVKEDEPALCTEIVLRAVNNVTVAMAAYAPNGSYPEGPGYWSYGTEFNVVLIAELEQALGSDFALATAPGFSLTGGYLDIVTGPSGRTFNYADGGDGRGYEPSRHWFATRYARPDWAALEVAQLRKTLAKWEPKRAASSDDRLLPLALLWLAEPAPGAVAVRTPLNWSSGGHVPVTVHRTAWNDPNATFIGVKAGSPSANHGHMDAGSFVLDADGVRWAWDLGAEDYHGIEARGMNLWDSKQESDRWKIFRLNSLSHNTLVIDGQLQRASATATILHFSDDSASLHTVVDLTSVYAGQAASVFRGVALLPSGQVVIRDSLRGLKPSSAVRWGMLTKAQPGAEGAAQLELKSGAKTLRLELLAPTGAVWREYETATPPAAWDSPNPGTRMVGFEIKAGPEGQLDLVVLLTPGSCAKDQRAAADPRLPQEWGTARGR